MYSWDYNVTYDSQCNTAVIHCVYVGYNSIIAFTMYSESHLHKLTTFASLLKRRN